MPQLSLYLDDEEMAILRNESTRTGKSLSRCAADAIKAQTNANAWPAGFFDLFGAINDKTFEAPEDTPYTLDEVVSFD